MNKLKMADWRKLPISLPELCINTTLRCGQSFRWRRSGEDEWSLALHNRILSLKQDPEALHYRAIFPTSSPLPSPPPLTVEEDDTLDLIKHYFNLRPNLGQLYEQWASGDSNFKTKAPKFTGVRILNQDVWEALIGFICSSNNNISRISQMVEKLCLHYGTYIGDINSQPYHDFPQPKALVGAKVEQHLRELGFGYRAKYLHRTAQMVEEKGVAWLEGLRNPESPLLGQTSSPAGEMIEGGREGYRHAHEQLLLLQGVGPKVADCVCLFGLGWGESVPIDTHVWQIAQRDYKFGKGKHSSLTKATYDAVANHFRALWGKEAGWAHSVLFTADLKTFSQRLVTKVEIAKVEGIGKEETGAQVDTSMDSKITLKRVKSESDENDDALLEAKEEKKRTVKRRRKA
ncbi:N-glycosylase/DNA lyase [Venturia nashicola]|nr:N-glycosylase/DNA lyase [Venturia nashicola]